MRKFLFLTIKYGTVVGLGLGALVHISFAAPVVTPATVAEIGRTSAVIKARVSNTGMYAATVWFEWGETSSLEKSVIGMKDIAGGGYFEYSLTGLKENVTYYFRAVAMDNDGEITRSPTTTFTTGDVVSVSDTVGGNEESVTLAVTVPTITVKKTEEKSSTEKETSMDTERTATTSGANTASLIGAGSGVFPQSLIGWIALFIVILIIVLLVHMIYDTNRKRKQALEKAVQEAKIKEEMQK